MKRKRLRAVMFGPQGSGKTTQGRTLAEHFGVPFIGAGDLLRREIEEKSALGKMVSEYVSSGMLAPDELIDAIVKKQLAEFDLTKGFVLDGYPRNIEQAMSMDKRVKVNIAIQLKIKDATAVKRLAGRVQCAKCRTVFHKSFLSDETKKCQKCGGKLQTREDDKEEIVRQRLAAYHFMTEPMATYYRKTGALLAVNAEQPIDDLFEELTRKLAKLGFMA